MTALTLFNGLEAVLWITIGGVVWWNSRLIARYRILGTVSAVWFVLFGISDIIEIFTGAWYQPLSLLLFKAVCLVALVGCGVTYRLIPRRK